MKRFLFILFSLLPLAVAAQYPTVTSQLSFARTQASHGLAVGDWITVDDSGVIVKGSDPSTQPFIGVVSKVVSSNAYEYAPPGGPITLSGLTAGEIYYAQTDGSIAPSSTATDTNKPALKAISSTQAILYSGSFGAANLASPSSVPQLNFSSITSSSFTLAVVKVGLTDGLMAVVSESPIAWTPLQNVVYTPNTVFEAGNDVSGGDGVYVVMFDNTTDNFSSAVITGLDPATTYYIIGYQFVNEGVLYSYSFGNGNSITTLSNASTPTEQWETTAIISKQTQLRIIGERGNGDEIIAIASTYGHPDTDPTDGVDYDVDDIIGNSRVTYTGTSDDFTMANFPRDTLVYFKIMEKENTGSLYYNNQADIDSAWTSAIYDSLFTEGVSLGQDYLEASSILYYDFTQLTGGTGDISNGNAGLVDYSPNANTGTIVSTPDVESQTIGAYSVPSLETASGESTAISTGHDGSTFFSSDFEVFFGITIADGQPTGFTQWIAGTTHSSFTDIFRISVNGTGNLLIRYTNGGQNGEWASTAAVFTDGANAHAVFRIKMDFTNDVFGVWKDGSSVAGSFTSGSMAALLPASFASDRNFYVGNLNSPTSAPTTILITRFTITPIVTTEQALDIEDLFNYIPTDAGDFSNWTVHETAGFTYSTVSDTLNLDGQPGGYEDYLTYNELIPDSLQEFVIKYTVKIADDLASGDVGTGPIMIHDVDTETNFSVFALLVTNPANANFGRVQLYSGTGAVGGTAMQFRSQSSATFIPEKDSVYEIQLIRTIENGINAFYTAKVIDKYDSSELTTSYLSVGALNTQYFGTTMRAGIYQNGGPFKINPFSVTRIGDDTIETGSSGGGGGGGSSGTVTYEVFVTVTGNDANDCSNPTTQACRTAGRAAQRVGQLGAGTDVLFGPGTFVEPSFVVWPTALDTLDGSGNTQTIFKGASNLYTDIATSGNGSPFSSYGYLFRFVSTSTTDVTTVMRNFSMEGNRNIGGNDNSMKGAIRIDLRDEITVKNVDIKYFNTTGIWAMNFDGLYIDDCNFIENGFADPIPGITYSMGQVQLFGDCIDFWFTDSYISSPVFDHGQGIQHSGSPNFYRIDAHIHRNEIIIGNSSDTEGGHHFSVELLYYYMLPGDSISMTGNLFRKNISLNYTGVEAGNHFIHNNRFTFDFPKNLAIESQGPNYEICHNYFSNIAGKAIGTYNGWGSGAPIPHCPRDCHANNQVFENMNIHNNVIELVSVKVANDPVFGDQLWRFDDVIIENNTIVYTTTSGGPHVLVRGGTQGVNDNWIVQNNAIHGQPPSGSTVFTTANGSSTFTNSFFRYNKATHLNVTQTLSGSGMSESNNTVTGSGNTLLFNLTGSKFPILQNSYYGWTTNAVLDGTGQGGSDIGGYEN